MNLPALYTFAADSILLIHVLVVLFNVLGLFLIFIGNMRNWSWIRNPWFRLAHLISISIVVILSWLNTVCPLTTIEMTLREYAGDTAYTGTFISHWLETVLYYQAPAWVFAVSYTLFGILVIISWFKIRPRHFSNPDIKDKT